MHVLYRGVQAVSRGAARCASQVLGRGTQNRCPRRDAFTAGVENLGRCTAEQSKYYGLYLYSGKLIAAMYLRRVRVVGRSFASALTHLSTVVHEEGESLPNTRRSRLSPNDDPSLCATFTLFVVLASSTSGDQHFCEIVTLYRPSSHQDWGRARTAGSRFARDDKEPGPSWGETITQRTAS